MDSDEATAERNDLLEMCRREKLRAVGFENDAELTADTDRALRYFKGDVGQDIPSLPNRSKAVSSDLSDAIETILPDLMEIFTGGDDVVAFIPQDEKDIEVAKQETQYLNHVVFQDNPGFLNFYTAIKDALLLKRGVFMWEWCEDREDQSEDFTGKNIVELQMAQQDGSVSNIKAEQGSVDLRYADPTFSFTVTREKDYSCAKFYPVAPDDFAAAPDTIDIAEATYCAMRARPRVQDLIAEGYDAAKVRALPSYAFGGNQETQQSRDNAGEHDANGGMGDDSSDDLRQVEIYKHYIRVLGDGDKLEIWCVVTDCDVGTELDRNKVERIPFAVGSPYLVAHRLIGRSLADLLIEIMKIKTVLTRAVLDSAYFALNQRNEVSMNDANDFTISDLLRNEPGVPVRSKTGQAVKPLAAGALGFDAYGALEYFNTVAEMRTGVVRNAQGLNPDTLHDTAKGAMTLLSAAQKRTKMIARVLAETLIKPFYLGMHAEIRENATSAKKAFIGNKFIPIDPTTWAERSAMTVEVGLGASGKDMEIAAMTQISGIMASIVKEQGGAQGPIVTLKNVYSAAVDFAKKLGVKAPSEYFTDPDSPEGQAAQQAMANRPDPEMAKVQGEQQLQAQKQQGEMQLGQLKVQSEQAIQANKSQYQAATDTRQQQLEHERMMAQQANEMALEQVRIASAERIAVAVARINAEAKISAAQVAAKVDDGAEDEAYQQSHESAPA